MDDDVRLSPRLEAMALIRQAQSQGGFGVVLHKGHDEAGTLMVVITEHGVDGRAYERMPNLDGGRNWTCAKRQTIEDPRELSQYLTRRGDQDPDLWIIELDIVAGERLIGLI